MSFAVPLVWRSQRLLFRLIVRLTNTTGIINKSKHNVKYSNCPSDFRPIPHSQIVHVPQPPENIDVKEENYLNAEKQEEMKKKIIFIILILRVQLLQMSYIYYYKAILAVWCVTFVVQKTGWTFKLKADGLEFLPL